MLSRKFQSIILSILLISLGFIISSDMVKGNEITNLTESIVVENNRTEYSRRQYVRDYSDSYIFSANVNLASTKTDYKIGLSAGINEISQNIDFVFDSSSNEIKSYATLYGSDRRIDLGYRRIMSVESNTTLNMKVIRNKNLFYFIYNDKLVQIREFDVEPTTPGFTVYNASVEYNDIYFNSEETKVLEEIQKYEKELGIMKLGKEYANFAFFSTNENGDIIIKDEMVDKVFEYSKIGISKSYSKDVLVEFTTSNLKINPTSESNQNRWPKLALMIYNDRGYADMICYGVAKKQDRIESFIMNDNQQWFNHVDLTGNTNLSSVLDRTSDINFKIYVENNITTKTYRVYVNDTLVAVRQAFTNGDISFGFASEFVSGTIKNIKITEIGD